MVGRKVLGEYPCRKEWFVVEASDYGIRGVENGAPRSLMISNRKAPVFEALASALNCFRTDTFFAEDRKRLSMYRFGYCFFAGART
jgi:hypothetical protein